MATGLRNKVPTPAERYRERWPNAEPAHRRYVQECARAASLSQTHRADSPELAAARERVEEANRAYKAACLKDEKAQRAAGTIGFREVRCRCGSHIPASFKRCPDCNRKLSVTGPP